MSKNLKLNDKVSFTVDGKSYEGYIYIVDANGTWENPGVPSYDIMTEDCLYKHIPHYLVKAQ